MTNKGKTLPVMPGLPPVGKMANDWQTTKLLHHNSQWWASQCIDAVVFNGNDRFTKLLSIVRRAPTGWSGVANS